MTDRDLDRSSATSTQKAFCRRRHLASARSSASSPASSSATTITKKNTKDRCSSSSLGSSSHRPRRPPLIQLPRLCISTVVVRCTPSSVVAARRRRLNHQQPARRTTGQQIRVLCLDRYIFPPRHSSSSPQFADRQAANVLDVPKSEPMALQYSHGIQCELEFSLELGREIPIARRRGRAYSSPIHGSSASGGGRRQTAGRPRSRAAIPRRLRTGARCRCRAGCYRDI